MSFIKDWLDQNADRLDCVALGLMSDWAVLHSFSSQDTMLPRGTQSIAWQLAAEAIQNTYKFRGCGGEITVPNDPLWQNTPHKCQKVLRAGRIQCTITNQYGVKFFYDLTEEDEALEILDFSPDGYYAIRVVYVDKNKNQSVVRGQTDWEKGIPYAWIDPPQNVYCVDQPPQYVDLGPAPPVIVDEVEDEDCKWTFSAVDQWIDTSGLIWTKFNAQVDPITCGEEFFFWTSERGNYYCAPGDWECPPPGSNRETETNCNPTLTGTTYLLEGFCEDPLEWGFEKDEDVAFEWEIPTTDALEGIAQRLDALAEMIDLSGWLRTPICEPSKPTLEGDWRTISFISDEVSPEGKSCLRKRFRYRSSSSVGLDDLVDHWKDFTFTAGAVIVQHKGASWGTPQVWASTIDEGKRVIRHAAREAGIDPDQVGEWRVSGSDNPRYGMPGTMRVNTSGGYYWITERLGSDSRPEVLSS